MAINDFFIDVSPVGISWRDWQGQIGYVLGAQQLPYVEDEAEWKTFARSLSDSPTLSAYGLPDPDAYEDWRLWVNELLTVSNGSGRQE